MIAALILAILLAYVEARNDAQDIIDHKPIDHLVGWVTRAAFMVFAVGGLYGMGAITSGWQVVAALIGSACAFSACFRWRLNKWRGVRAVYISPSSWYDWQFLRLFLPFDRTEAVEAWHIYMDSRDARKAGMVAYMTEGTMVLACFAFYRWV